MQPVWKNASPPIAGVCISDSTWRRPHGQGASSNEGTSLRDSPGNPSALRQNTVEEWYVPALGSNVTVTPYQTWDAEVLTPLWPTLRSADHRAVFSFLSGALSMDPEAAAWNFQPEKVNKYQDVWEEARKFAQTYPTYQSLPFCSSPPDRQEELISAIHGYTLHRPNICMAFNDACRRATFFKAGQEGWKDFEYKSFWWLLMEAFFTLPKDTEERVWIRGNGTSTLFRGIGGMVVPQEPGDIIIFGQFLSTSQTPMAALKFATPPRPLLLELRGVPRHLHREITRFGYYRHWEVLVAPFCVFRFAGEREDDGNRVMELEFVECLLEPPGVMLGISKRIVDGELWAWER